MSINVEKLVEQRESAQYPMFTIINPNDTLPLTVNSLKKGEAPLVVELNGKKKIVTKIDLSALNVNMLLRTCGELKVNKSKDDYFLVKSVDDYLAEI